jgi:hypothetical protein
MARENIRAQLKLVWLLLNWPSTANCRASPRMNARARCSGNTEMVKSAANINTRINLCPMLINTLIAFLLEDYIP